MCIKKKARRGGKRFEGTVDALTRRADARVREDRRARRNARHGSVVRRTTHRAADTKPRSTNGGHVKSREATTQATE